MLTVRPLRPRLRLLATLISLPVAATALSLPHPQVAHAAAEASNDGGFVPLSPTVRVLATSSGIGVPKGTVGAGVTKAFQVLGVGGIPASGVTSVLVDVTVQGPSAPTFLRLWADGQPQPGTTAISVPGGGRNFSNAAIVPVGSNGKADVFNAAGTTNIIVDVEGYFTPVTSGGGQGRYVPVAQTRLISTIGGTGVPKAKIPANGSITFTLTTGPIPADATVVYANITARATAAGWLVAFPAGGSAGSTSTLDFVTGDTASGTAIKVGTGGRVTVANHSTAPIDIILDVHGYFSPTAANGANLQAASARLFDSRSSAAVAANATVDISVGGTNGLPLRDIAGAAINVHVSNATAAGWLRAWPTGTPEPVTSLANHPVNEARSDLGIIQPGRDGKITIRNGSGGTIQLIVDLEGWFAPPVAPLPVERFSPTALIQGPGGAFEYAYVDNIGQLFEGRQTDVDTFNPASTQWTALSGNEAFTGQPAVALHEDGRVQVAAHNVDRDIWTRSHTSRDGPDWAAWGDQGGSMASTVTAGRLPTDASLVLFATDADGQLWQLPQNGPNGAYPGWRNLGDADLAGAPTVAVLRDGLQLVALDTAGQPKTATYRAGALSTWTSLGGSGFNGTPAVVVLPGDRLRVFVRAGDGTIMTKQQDPVTGAWPSAWEPISGAVAAGSPTAVLSPSSGRIELVARRADGHYLSTGETEQASGIWRPWLEVTNQFGEALVAATDPTAVTYTDCGGRTWGFVVRNSDQQNTFQPARACQFGLADSDLDAPPSFSFHTLPKPQP